MLEGLDTPENLREIQQDIVPTGWEVLPLGQVATLQRGKDLPKSQRTHGPYPVIGSNGVVGYHSEAVAHGPGVLIGRSGSVGKATWIGHDYWPLNTALWVKDFHGNDPEFVYYLLDYIDLGRFAAGVSVPTLNRNLVHPVKVAIPAASEQRSIAHALHTAQEAKEATEQVIEAARELKRSLMNHLFTYGPVPVDEADQVPLKETTIGQVPRHWETVELGELIATGPQNGLYKPQSLYGDGTAIVRIDDFGNEGGIIDETLNRVQLLATEIERYRLYSNDILVNRVNSLSHLGKSVLVGDFVEPAVFESNMMRFSIDAYLAVPEYVARFLASPIAREQMRGKAKRAVAQSSINQGDVRSIVLPLPPLSEQEEIVDILSRAENKNTAEESRAASLEVLFETLLHNLMTGKVRVNDSDIPEVEEVV
jgi:type I restriction enzyme S subunit